MCQLKNIDSFIEVRERYSQLYSEAFKNIPEITPINPKPPSSTKHARHLYIILLNLERLKIMRNQFIDCLKQENIGAGVHFKSLHLQTYYKDAYALKADFFPNANSVSERAVSLPLYPKMSDRDVHNVIFAVRKITNAFKK
jgi:dTDP-4-amino-4,6-dideoxygalactose transaminase